MSGDAQPIEGNWYEAEDRGAPFFVVTVDEDEGIVEIQHLSGKLEEIELDDWQDMEFTPIDQPDNYPGDMDEILDEDEIPCTVDEMDSDDRWAAPLTDLDD